MDNIEEDKLANEVLEGLPPSFMVFGAKKAVDPLEEFWMNKLTNIERQYDQHIVDLGGKLLKDRENRRSIKKQASKIGKLKQDLSERTQELEGFKSKTGVLKGKLKEKEYEAKSYQEKFENATTAYKSVSKRMQDERQARMHYEKESRELKNRLKALEKERSQLVLDIEIKGSEKAKVEERELALDKERWSFVRKLSETDTERRIQTNANIQLCQDMEKLLNVEKSLEGTLLKERQVMSEMMGEMKRQKEQHQNALRQLDIAIKEKRNVQEGLELSFKKAKDLERDARHWKEELTFKEEDSSAKNNEIKDLKRRNSQIRCMLADTRHRLNACLSEMQSLENEKRKTDIELQSTKRCEKSLRLEIWKNDMRKYKLAEKILKAHPYLFQKTPEEGSARSKGDRKMESSSSQNLEMESYKKNIWKIERRKDEVERKLRELQRKENIYRIKLEKFSGMEKEIFWTGKAMAKLEGDRNRLEALMQTMESNMPVKVPFKKLVTDPSVLDRLAKNRVLQKRIFQQAEKIEELKSSARRILKYREEEFGAMRRREEEIPIWKLDYWNKHDAIPDNILSGVSIDVTKYAGGNNRFQQYPVSFTEERFYKNYLHHLDDEIPKLKQEISHLEKKRIHNEWENENKESHKQKLQAIKSERKKFSAMLLSDEHEDIAENLDESKIPGKTDQCTPDVSMHGSDFGDDDADDLPGGNTESSPKLQKQSASRMPSSSTEDERDDLSSDAGSNTPSDN